MSCSLVLENICLKTSEKILCNTLNLRVGHKEKIALWGPNGSGKTTLLETIAGLSFPCNGTIELFHHPVRNRKDYLPFRSEIGYLFQDSDDQFLAPVVRDDVAFGLLAAGMNPEEASRETDNMLSSLGIFHLRDSIVYRLSGGEKKLVALAGVLITKPRLLLLDEPTNGLDTDMQARLIALLRTIDKSMVIVSHHRDFLDTLAHRVYAMDTTGLTLLPSSPALTPGQGNSKKSYQ